MRRCLAFTKNIAEANRFQTAGSSGFRRLNCAVEAREMLTQLVRAGL